MQFNYRVPTYLIAALPSAHVAISTHHCWCNSKVNMYHCQICEQYARVSLKEIIHHIRDMHHHFTTPVRCGVNGCPSTATSYDSLHQHTYKKHRNEVIPEDHSNSVPITSFQGSDEPESSVLTEEGSHIPASSTPSTAATKSASLEAARFILKLRDGKGLPHTVTDSILTDIQVMIDSTNDNLKGKLLNTYWMLTNYLVAK